ncbi:biopolymer transporter ExbD [Ectothiorhodospiraceae bacterium WFHF3C12]|nr:biopolymer transporter ExbD [Ectothiorhodospiraceae bacterium WFHF3C12]
MNVTAFMNLMVVLVPFLLIMAVFSRITILELNLPSGDGGAAEDTPELQLEVIVRKQGIEVAGRRIGTIERVGTSESGYDLQALSGALKDLKARYPDKTDVTILLEPDIPYEQVVAVMDTVRVTRVSQAGDLVTAELFPDISIGDAPEGAGG